MALWSIGSIRGQFQPETFNETQGTKLEDIEVFGNVPILLHKGWDTREISISFVVDGMCDPVEQNQTWARDQVNRSALLQTEPEPRAADPEQVWAEIQRMQRPIEFGVPRSVRVTIPGWDPAGQGNHPRFAVISSASINRTHIAGEASRAVRAIISVTLRESRRLIGAAKNNPEGRRALETAATGSAQAQITKIIGDAKTQEADFNAA
jgi:hypothetical protein